MAEIEKIRQQEAKSKSTNLFMGMSDHEILNNKSVFEEMGLI